MHAAHVRFARAAANPGNLGTMAAGRAPGRGPGFFNGVSGQGGSNNGIGAFGSGGGNGQGVFGQAGGTGAGVQGDGLFSNSTGVLATNSSGGTALHVNGTASSAAAGWSPCRPAIRRSPIPGYL